MNVKEFLELPAELLAHCSAHEFKRKLREHRAEQWLDKIVDDYHHPDWSIAADAQCLISVEFDYQSKAIKERVLLWLAGIMSPDKGAKSTHAEALINKIVRIYTQEMEE